MNGNSRLLKILATVVSGLLLSAFVGIATVWSDFADEKDVIANKVSIIEQEVRCSQRHKEVDEINRRITSIDTALKILIPGYKDSK